MFTFNGETKTIEYGDANIISVRDLWSRWVDWFLTDDNSKFMPAFDTVGGNEIDPLEGTYIPVYAFLLNGWTINLSERNHTVKVKDGILVAKDGATIFNNTVGPYSASASYYLPVMAIGFNPGESVGLTAEVIADEVMARDVLTENSFLHLK